MADITDLIKTGASLSPWGALATSAWQIGSGLYDKYKANNLANTPRPDMTTPASQVEMLQNARGRAGMENTPGLENALDAKTAAAAMKLQHVSPSSASLLGATADVYGKEMGVLADSRADYYNRSQDNLNTALAGDAESTMKNWMWNTGQPYLNAIGAAGKYAATGRQDVANGINTASNYQQMIAMMKMFGGGGAGGPVGGGENLGPAPER